MSIDEDWKESPEVHRPKMSLLTKVLIALGIGAGLCALACCGGVVYLTLNAERLAKAVFSDDPEVIRKRTQEMVEIDIPPQFTPKVSMNIVLMSLVIYEYEPAADAKEDAEPAAEGEVPPKAEPEAPEALPAAATSEPKAPKGTLILAQFSRPLANDPNLRNDTLQKQLEEEDRNRPRVRITRTEDREFEIRGQTVQFQFAEGVEEKTDVPMRQVTGTFRGKDDSLVMFLLVVPEQDYDETQVVEMIKSIR